MYDDRLPLVRDFTNKQTFYVEFTQKDIVAGHHYHKKKVELDWIPLGKLRFLLEDIKTGAQESFDVDAEDHKVILIPKYVSHAVISLSVPAILLGITNGYDEAEDIYPYEIKNLNSSDCQLYTKDIIEEEILSINFHLPSQISAGIMQVSDEIRSAYPNHFYYSPERLHTTLLARIPKDTSIDILVGIITKYKKLYPFHLLFEGIGASNRIISVPAFDLYDQIHAFRAAIRTKVTSSDDYTKYDPVWEQILWVNFVRFQSVPDQSLFKFVLRFKTRIYGYLSDPPVELYLNQSQTLDPKYSKLITTIS